MHIAAEKIDPDKTTRLEIRSDGDLILWLLYPRHPEKDTGFPIKCLQLATLIKEHSLTVLEHEKPESGS